MSDLTPTDEPRLPREPECETCTVAECDRPAPYRTPQRLCKTHWHRWNKTGSTDPWRPESNVSRFVRQIVQDGQCWRWTGTSLRGYGIITLVGRRREYVHRWSYEHHRAPIPHGLTIDHLCRNTWCANPWHLEPVPQSINSQRVNAAAEYCRNGHRFTEQNSYWGPPRNGRPARQCRTCRRQSDRRRRRTAREVSA